MTGTSSFTYSVQTSGGHSSANYFAATTNDESGIYNFVLRQSFTLAVATTVQLTSYYQEKRAAGLGLGNSALQFSFDGRNNQSAYSSPNQDSFWFQYTFQQNLAAGAHFVEVYAENDDADIGTEIGLDDFSLVDLSLPACS